MRYFPIFLFLCLACQPQQERAAKKSPALPAVDTLRCGHLPGLRWVTKKGDSTITIKFCENGYENSDIRTVKYHYAVADDTLAAWINRGLLHSYLDYSDGKYWEVMYTYRQNGNKQWSHFCFYEIVIKTDKGETRTSGILHQIGWKRQFIAGGVYISDTTQQFGWFVLDVPYRAKPPVRANPPRKHPFIFSSHPKAKILCGEYPERYKGAYSEIESSGGIIKPRKPQ